MSTSAGAAGAEPGQGSGTPEGSQQQQQQQREKADQPQFVTAEQVTQIVNQAITSRNTAFEKKVSGLLAERDKALAESLTTAMSGLLDERFKALAPAPQDDKSKKADKDKKEPATPEASPELKALQEQFAAQQKEVERLKKDADKSAREAADERRKARDVALRQKTLDELGKLQLTGERGALALASLRDQIGYEDDKSERLVFRKGDEVLGLEDGLKEWAKSEQARILLPPRGTQGSGDGPTPRGAEGSAKPSAAREIGLGLMQHWGINSGNTTGA